MNLKQVYLLSKSASYEEFMKAKFKKAAMKYLRELATELKLETGTFDVRFNAGGPAVSGDATLHHEKFYFTIGEFGVMWRTCKGRKDYVGGGNRWAIGFVEETKDADLIEQIFRVLKN